MSWAIVYILLAIIVGALGRERNISFWLSFILSLLLSPLVGLIFVLFSDRK